jgi:hypothetical protein
VAALVSQGFWKVRIPTRRAITLVNCGSRRESYERPNSETSYPNQLGLRRIGDRSPSLSRSSNRRRQSSPMSNRFYRSYSRFRGDSLKQRLSQESRLKSGLLSLPSSPCILGSNRGRKCASNIESCRGPNQSSFHPSKTCIGKQIHAYCNWNTDFHARCLFLCAPTGTQVAGRASVNPRARLF